MTSSVFSMFCWWGFTTWGQHIVGLMKFTFHLFLQLGFITWGQPSFFFSQRSVWTRLGHRQTWPRNVTINRQLHKMIDKLFSKEGILLTRSIRVLRDKIKSICGFTKIGKFEDFGGENYRKKVKKKKRSRKEKIIVLMYFWKNLK